MTDAVFPDRITQLRARWEADPSSRIFLQLAEEYRHLGRIREALDVLDRGLREHPGYLSALVAKGRCHLELGEAEAARGVLERVVKQDATQMVANKLLVRTYLETGDPAKARERLDLYSLLNDSDPEIEELRRRIKLLDRPPQAGPGPQPGGPSMEADPFSLDPGPAPRADSRPDSRPTPSRPEPAAADIFDLGGPPGPRREVADVFALEEVAPVAASPAPAPVFEEPEEAADGDLFPGLASRDRRRRYLDALSAEGLFAVAAPETAADASPVTSPAPPPVARPAAPEPDPFADLAPPPPVAAAAPEPLPFPDTEPFAPAPPTLETPAIHEDTSWLEEAAAAAPAPAQAAAAPEPFEISTFAPPAPPPTAEEDLWSEEPTEAWSPAPPAEPPSELLPPLALDEPEPAAATWEPLAEEPVAAAPPAEPPPAEPEPLSASETATLGELYLRQGHHREAERIFREVLRREPDNAAAREGLERLAETPEPARREAPPLDADQLLEGFRPGPQDVGQAGVRARKVFALNRYLERLRGNGPHVS